ncbi:MAG: DUF58 domain-containing protein [Deltaproteobacteria bacterium]|nr:DUF58 domain-containing protein [Deltaproteobacteria bacterium]
MQPGTLSSSITQPISVGRLWSAFRSLNFLLTLRGLLVLIFIGLLFLGPVSNDHDIVASIFAYVLLSVLILSISLTVLQGLALRKTLRVSLHAPSEGASGEAVVSGASTRFLLRTSKVQLAPLFVLTIQPEFQHDGVVPSIHRLTGTAAQDRFLNELISFPHRGDWSITRIVASVGDQLGFTQLSWEMDPNPAQIFRVEPPRVQETQLPIISSCQRSGDMLMAAHDRLGDPFDLKSYHPSDGLKKVVWKIFARTGELIARHPEHSMNPEGQVILHCIAGQADDHVCAAALAYSRQLRELDLELFFGCEGMNGHAIARSAEQACDLLVETAWGEIRSTEDVSHLLQKCSEELLDSRIDKIVLFAPKDMLETEEDLQRVFDIAEFLEQRQITPIFYIIENKAAKAPEIAPPAALPARVQNWFFSSSGVKPLDSEEGYRYFSTVCSQREWGLFVS